MVVPSTSRLFVRLVARRFAGALEASRAPSASTSAAHCTQQCGPRIHYLDVPQTQPSSARLQRQQVGRGRLKPGAQPSEAWNRQLYLLLSLSLNPIPTFCHHPLSNKGLVLQLNSCLLYFAVRTDSQQYSRCPQSNANSYGFQKTR